MPEKPQNLLKYYTKSSFLASGVSFAFFVLTVLPSMFENAQATLLDNKTHQAKIVETPKISDFGQFALGISVVMGSLGLVLSKQIPRNNSLKLIKKYGFENKFKESIKKTGLTLEELSEKYGPEITYFFIKYSSLIKEFGFKHIARNRKTLPIPIAFYELCFTKLIEYIDKDNPNTKDRESLCRSFNSIHKYLKDKHTE